MCQQAGKWAIAANTKGFAVGRKTGSERLLFLTIYGSMPLTDCGSNSLGGLIDRQRQPQTLPDHLRAGVPEGLLLGAEAGSRDCDVRRAFVR